MKTQGNTYLVKKGKKTEIKRFSTMLNCDKWCNENGYKWQVLGMRSIAQLKEDSLIEVTL